MNGKTLCIASKSRCEVLVSGCISRKGTRDVRSTHVCQHYTAHANVISHILVTWTVKRRSVPRKQINDMIIRSLKQDTRRQHQLINVQNRLHSFVHVYSRNCDHVGLPKFRYIQGAVEAARSWLANSLENSDSKLMITGNHWWRVSRRLSEWERPRVLRDFFIELLVSIRNLRLRVRLLCTFLAIVS